MGHLTPTESKTVIGTRSSYKQHGVAQGHPRHHISGPVVLDDLGNSLLQVK